MSLVEVHTSKLVAQCLKGPYAANTEQVFLPYTCAVIPTIEASAEADEFGRVVWMEGVEEIHRNYMAANTDNLGFPNAGIEGRAIQWELNGLTGIGQMLVGVNWSIGFGLNASVVQVLPSVSLPIEQTHPNQGKTDISR